ncbi:DUF3551 domain-containing protein [Bradyrhizobium genosp. L]|nr:DUF3551 domain-containing protein [Bradyrhizobium genosp. L]QPF88421.1 DUF3551 domain-containing protein [Bradyrhizobium genosp. L]
MTLAGAASVGSASAQDYPWCAQGPSLGYPGECAYQTYQQCQASVSGRFLACGENPVVLFRRQQWQGERQWQGDPRPHHRHWRKHRRGHRR